MTEAQLIAIAIRIIFVACGITGGVFVGLVAAGGHL